MGRSRAVGGDGKRDTPSRRSQRAAVRRGGHGARAVLSGVYGGQPTVAVRSTFVGDSTIAVHGGTDGGAGQHDGKQRHADVKTASDGVAAAVDGSVLPTDGGVIGGGDGVGAAVVDGLPTQCRDGSEDGDFLEQPQARLAEEAAAA